VGFSSFYLFIFFFKIFLGNFCQQARGCIKMLIAFKYVILLLIFYTHFYLPLAVFLWLSLSFVWGKCIKRIGFYDWQAIWAETWG